MTGFILGLIMGGSLVLVLMALLQANNEGSDQSENEEEYPAEVRTITPQDAIIRLNNIRGNAYERLPEIDMAIKAINHCMVKRKPIDEENCGSGGCPSCRGWVVEYDSFCPMCGQALDWHS